MLSIEFTAKEEISNEQMLERSYFCIKSIGYACVPRRRKIVGKICWK